MEIRRQEVPGVLSAESSAVEGSAFEAPGDGLNDGSGLEDELEEVFGDLDR